MASVRGKMPVGSSPWINDERHHINQFIEQEVEEFAFAARNEVEWLNEHMAEIFSRNQLNVTEIFKTPGKLRGKTPRTARKKGAPEGRAPLTDIFQTNALSLPSSTRGYNHPDNTPSLQDGQEIAIRSESKLPDINGESSNTDSGYHEVSEDKMDIDEVTIGALPPTTQTTELTKPGRSDDEAPGELQNEPSTQEHRTTDGSFHSARENVTEKIATEDPQQMDVDEPSRVITDVIPAALQVRPVDVDSYSPQRGETGVGGEDKESLLGGDHDMVSSHSTSEESSPIKPLTRKGSLTFAALPAREPLTTKKSIGARASRTSHLEQARVNPAGRGSYLGRFTGGKSLGGIRQPDYNDEGEEKDEMEIGRTTLLKEDSDQDSKIAKLHNKSSTQRLHDRINLLGQTRTARPSKSIPAAAALSLQPVYPDLPASGAHEKTAGNGGIAPPTTFHAAAQNAVEDEDDWIQPPSKQTERQARPPLAKSRSVDVMEHISGKDSIGGEEFAGSVVDKEAKRQASPLRLMAGNHKPVEAPAVPKETSARVRASPTRSLPQAGVVYNGATSARGTGLPKLESTIPAGFPAAHSHADGPLTASKSKLQSIIKSARGLFTSSAGVSAQAKLETLSPSSMTLRSQGKTTITENLTSSKRDPSTLNRMIYPDLPVPSENLLEDKSAITGNQRRTRSSTEKEARDQENSTQRQGSSVSALKQPESSDLHDECDPNSTTKPTSEDHTMTTAAKKLMKPTRQSPRVLHKDQDKITDMKSLQTATGAVQPNGDQHSMAPPPARMQPQPSQLQRPKELRRPVKPAKEVAPKPKPQPVAIRVGTLSQRIPLTNSALSSSLQESLPSQQTKHPTLGKKASNVSSQTSSSSSTFKSSVSSATSKPKALLAAERKKEQEVKEAQRKLEHKREIERKRAAQQEEAHKREQQQRQEAERQREREREESKKMAQNQANDKKRLELSKKDQQKDTQRAANDLAHAMQQERTQPQMPSYRSDLGPARQASRLITNQESQRIPSNYAPNPAKPPKRVFEVEQDDEPARPSRLPGGQTFHANESKRRRTEDAEEHSVPARPTMAPPVRQSNARKENTKVSLFSSNYNSVAGPATHHAGPSLLKTTTTTQAYQQYQYQSQTNRAGHPLDMAKYTNGKIPFAEAPNPPPASHKTPLPSRQGMAGPSKSSPVFPNGDNIQLDEIPTDSEDDDDSEDEKSKKKKNLPEWALTPNLNEKLMEQERLNPDVLFGPVAPLVMEEIFKDKNRHHRFRSRTSSANWFGQDRLTEEDIRNDNAAREKLRRDGGWSFGL